MRLQDPTPPDRGVGVLLAHNENLPVPFSQVEPTHKMRLRLAIMPESLGLGRLSEVTSTCYTVHYVDLVLKSDDEATEAFEKVMAAFDANETLVLRSAMITRISDTKVVASWPNRSFT